LPSCLLDQSREPAKMQLSEPRACQGVSSRSAAGAACASLFDKIIQIAHHPVDSCAFGGTRLARNV
jgi:hypothetical protein